MPCARGAWALLRRAIAGLLICGGLAATAGHAADSQGVVTLGDKQPPMNAQRLGGAWVDATGGTSFEQVLAGAGRFQPPSPDRVYALGAQGALWLHYRLSLEPRARIRWQLAFPMPAIDSVTVYQEDDTGQWVGQTSGDTMAVAKWPEAGRYPHFRLYLRRGSTRDVYVRIRHEMPGNFPVELLDGAAFEYRVQVEYLGLGVTFGAMLLLMAACLAQSLVYRDRAYAWYALYLLAIMLCVSSYTGVAAHLLWPGFDALGDAPAACLTLLAAAAELLFVRSLAGISARHRVIDRLVLGSGLAGIGLAVLLPMLPKGPALTMVAAYVAGSTFASMGIALAAWRRGDVVGAWLLAAYVPLSMAIVLTLARVFGWVPLPWAGQYTLVAATGLAVPLLLVALSLRSRDRHGARIRELALSSQDALTGLLAPHLFLDRLRQVLARHNRHRENTAVMFIELVNFRRIKEAHGPAVADQSLLRTVMKLRRVVRDLDTVSRIGEPRFGLIIEGVASRNAVTERAASVIAAGLMPLAGLKPEVILQFHCSAVLLYEKSMEAPDLALALHELLDRMSPRTRRPIRFLEPDATVDVPADADSALFDQDSVLPAPGVA
ncbi:MAG: hypothetical protein JWP43_1481 [Ramlibacter sp.]|nr:hypothetical protein [Ramlibacter sp.]